MTGDALTRVPASACEVSDRTTAEIPGESPCAKPGPGVIVIRRPHPAASPTTRSGAVSAGDRKLLTAYGSLPALGRWQ